MANSSYKSLFKDQAGKPSLMRVLFFLWAIVVLVVWVVISIKTWQVHDLSMSIAIILGTLAGGKAVQRFAEKRE